MEDKRPPNQQPNSSTRRALPPQRVLDSEELLGGEKEVLIVHHGEVYRLRETRNGKLLLGK